MLNLTTEPNPVTGKGASARNRLCFISAGVIVALALVSTGAGASGGSTNASSCSNQTVNGGKYVGKITLRFGLIGTVSCNEAHRVVRAYFRKMAAGQCGAQNNFCNLQFPGGWDCSIFFATESKETGGAIAGCARTGAKIRLYKARRPTTMHGTLHLREFVSPDKLVLCLLKNEVYCNVGNSSGNGFHSGVVERNGRVSVCNKPPGGNYCGAGGNDTPVLHYGQQDEVNGFLCTSATNGITCTVVAGTGGGKGFRINKDEAVAIG